MTTNWDAIVIGAGPAGSLAARQIAMRGRRVLLLDKKHFPRRKVCGACLNHSAVAMFEAIGLSDVIRGCGGRELTRFELRAASRRLMLALPHGVAISRALLDQRLVDAAICAGVTFRDGVTAAVGASDDRSRIVHVREASATESDADRGLSAKVVIVADGLGHPSLHGSREVLDLPQRNARVGVGCEVHEFSSDYSSGTIQMAVGRGGYVGLVRVESGALNIAAAFDARMLRDAGGPAQSAASVLAQTGFPPIPAMNNVEWLGTPLLTRTTSPVAAERMFVLGDAAGYVEPFTGEGIGWAISSAVAIAPLANAACEQWQPSLATQWSREHARLVRHRQRTCRVLATLLKHPACVSLAMMMLSRMPRLLQPLVRAVSLPAPSQLMAGRYG